MYSHDTREKLPFLASLPRTKDSRDETKGNKTGYTHVKIFTKEIGSISMVLAKKEKQEEGIGKREAFNHQLLENNITGDKHKLDFCGKSDRLKLLAKNILAVVKKWRTEVKGSAGAGLGTPTLVNENKSNVIPYRRRAIPPCGPPSLATKPDQQESLTQEPIIIPRHASRAATSRFIVVLATQEIAPRLSFQQIGLGYKRFALVRFVSAIKMSTKHIVSGYQSREADMSQELKEREGEGGYFKMLYTLRYQVTATCGENILQHESLFSTEDAPKHLNSQLRNAGWPCVRDHTQLTTKFHTTKFQTHPWKQQLSCEHYYNACNVFAEQLSSTSVCVLPYKLLAASQCPYLGAKTPMSKLRLALAVS
uniref:Uncharacterized protein n=1 Tax=Timema poppense TaxID=170557 RepID=A0A7R9H3T3_TIMPO|nr:unnamed protein product [Timema poppensis]